MVDGDYMKDIRLRSRNIPKDVEMRLIEHNGDLEMVFKDVVLEAHAAHDKWKRKHLELECNYIIQLAKKADTENLNKFADPSDIAIDDLLNTEVSV